MRGEGQATKGRGQTGRPPKRDIHEGEPPQGGVGGDIALTLSFIGAGSVVTYNLTRRFGEAERSVSNTSPNTFPFDTGNPGSMHIWWARKPLAASRAAVYSALINEPYSEEERSDSLKFIAVSYTHIRAH